MADIRHDPEKNRLIVQPFGGDEMTVLLKLPSRRWMKRAGNFVVPLTRMNSMNLVEAARNSKMFIPHDLRPLIEQVASRAAGRREFPTWYNFKTQPFPDQRAAILKAYRDNVWGLFMRMGTGKSKVIIDVFTAAFYERQIDFAVIVCPLAVAPVWTGETGQLVTHCPAPIAIELVDSRFEAADLEPKQDRMTWLIVGVESLSQGRTFERLIPLLQNYKVGLAVDESSRIKNHKAIRTDRVTELGKLAKIKGIATGTPATKNLMDLYSQFEFLDTNIVGVGDYYAFRNRYAIMGGYKKKEIIGYDNVDELMGLVEPYVYICDKPKGMPEQLWGERYVELAPEQKDMYYKVKGAEIEGVKVASVLNRMQKLQEVTAGFLREDPKLILSELTGREKKVQGDIIWHLPVDKNPKLIELATKIDDLGDEQLIVWSRHLVEIDDIYEVMAARGPTLKLTGAVPVEERAGLIEKFQKGGFRFIVSNQQIGGIGHTMTASHLGWYLSNTNSLEDRLQSEDRIHRTGQTEGCFYLDFMAKNTVDVSIWQSTKLKKDLDVYIRDKLKEAGARALEDLFGSP